MIFCNIYMENSKLYNIKKIEKQNRNHLCKHLVLLQQLSITYNQCLSLV